MSSGHCSSKCNVAFRGKPEGEHDWAMLDDRGNDHCAICEDITTCDGVRLGDQRERGSVNWLLAELAVIIDDLAFGPGPMTSRRARLLNDAVILRASISVEVSESISVRDPVLTRVWHLDLRE